MIRVLVVDRKVTALELEGDLVKDGCIVTIAEKSHEALGLIKEEEPDIVIMGAELPGGGDGLDLLSRLRFLHPLLDVIMLVDQTRVDAAVKSIRLGACDCIAKPVNVSELVPAIHSAYRSKAMRHRETPDSVQKESPPHRLVGESPQIQEVKRLISLVGPTMAPVLILGETGTGKELVARAVHEASKRSSGPFVTVNMSALPDNILESELCGYKKGAFTNADSDKTGLLDIADKGTFFADEVGDTALSIQARLLRIAETGSFRKLGDTKERRVSVRLVCATNKDLEQEARDKRFRADLYYRLSTFIIHVPPLRERKEDIPLLVNHFLHKARRVREPVSISPEALKLLIDYPWPGNVRELSNILDRACVLSGGDSEIRASALPLDIMQYRLIKARMNGRATNSVRLQDAQREYIEQILAAANGNKSRAARVLGISRTKLYRSEQEKKLTT